jgi:hypothetical protein
VITIRTVKWEEGVRRGRPSNYRFLAFQQLISVFGSNRFSSPYGNTHSGLRYAKHLSKGRHGFTFASVHGDDVSVSKPISLHDLTNLNLNAFLKHRPDDDDGVNLSILSARVNSHGKFRQQAT